MENKTTLSGHTEIDLRKDKSQGPWEIKIVSGKGKGKIVWVENSDPDLIEKALNSAKLSLDYVSC